MTPIWWLKNNRLHSKRCVFRWGYSNTYLFRMNTVSQYFEVNNHQRVVWKTHTWTHLSIGLGSVCTCECLYLLSKAFQSNIIIFFADHNTVTVTQTFIYTRRQRCTQISTNIHKECKHQLKIRHRADSWRNITGHRKVSSTKYVHIPAVIWWVNQSDVHGETH